MRLYIIRHADPDYKNRTITPKGHTEAEALAQRMAGENLTRIYSSPLGRAQDTARYTAEATGLTPQIEPWTAELSIDGITGIDGVKWAPWNIEGETIRNQGQLPTHESWHQHPALAHYDYRAHFEELKAASDEFMERLGYKRNGGVYEIKQANTDRIAVFCHGGFGIAWLAHLLEIPLTLAWCGFFWAPSSVTTIVMEERSSRFAVPRALCVGDTSHIYAASLPASSRGSTANFD